MRVKSRRRRRTKREIIQDDLLKVETQRTMAEFARKKTSPVKLIESKPKIVLTVSKPKIVLTESKPKEIVLKESKPKEPEPIVLKEIEPEMKIVLTEVKSKTTEKEKESSET